MNHIAETKQFRRDLDATLQQIKTSPRQSRERSLAITNIQQGIMWLGMDLKDQGGPVDPLDAARLAYHSYAEVVDFKNFRGDPMPAFDDLPEQIQKAWVAASQARVGNPYPQSYNLDSPVIEQTADGLKL